jgi:hypothetical protein
VLADELPGALLAEEVDAAGGDARGRATLGEAVGEEQEALSCAQRQAARLELRLLPTDAERRPDPAPGQWVTGVEPPRDVVPGTGPDDLVGRRGPMLTQAVVTNWARSAPLSASAASASCSSWTGSLVNRAKVASAARTKAAWRAASRPCPTTSPTTIVVHSEGLSTTRKNSPATRPSAGVKAVASCRVLERRHRGRGECRAQRLELGELALLCAHPAGQLTGPAEQHPDEGRHPGEHQRAVDRRDPQLGVGQVGGGRDQLVPDEQHGGCGGDQQAAAEAEPVHPEHHRDQHVHRDREAGTVDRREHRGHREEENRQHGRLGRLPP